MLKIVCMNIIGKGAFSKNRIRCSVWQITKRLTKHYYSFKIWMRIFPDKPITKKAAETKMGKGKGSVDHYVFPVKPGRILFELDGISYKKVKEAFRLANSKLPIKTSIIRKQ